MVPYYATRDETQASGSFRKVQKERFGSPRVSLSSSPQLTNFLKLYIFKIEHRRNPANKLLRGCKMPYSGTWIQLDSYASASTFSCIASPPSYYKYDSCDAHAAHIPLSNSIVGSRFLSKIFVPYFTRLFMGNVWASTYKNREQHCKIVIFT